MATETDSLDARMEAIKIKNDELEKKHREILEDEQIAKRENATVNVNSARDTPKNAHPYDHIDLDFDVKDKDKELTKNPDFKPKNRRPMPRNEFLAEIPPDPTNFLREDGDDTTNAEPGQTPRPQNNRNNRINNNRNRVDRPRQERSNNEFDSLYGDSPDRPRQQRPRPPQQQSRSPQDPNAPIKRPTPPSQLRNERRSAVPDRDQQQQRSPTGPPQQAQPNRQRRPNNSRQPNKEGGDLNNITVQISEGEVRSVKLKSPEKQYGTGRVGRPRNENVQKFTVDTFDPENTDEADQQDRSPNDRPRNRNHRNRRSQKPKEFQHPTLENIIIPKASVQDRLMKIAKDPLTPTEGEVHADAPIVPVDEPKENIEVQGEKIEAAPVVPAVESSNGN